MSFSRSSSSPLRQEKKILGYPFVSLGPIPGWRETNRITVGLPGNTPMIPPKAGIPIPDLTTTCGKR